MTKKELLEQLDMWLGRIEDGAIFDDVEDDDVVNVRSFLNGIADCIVD